MTCRTALAKRAGSCKSQGPKIAAPSDQTGDFRASPGPPIARCVFDLGVLTLHTPVDTLERRKNTVFLPNRLHRLESSFPTTGLPVNQNPRGYVLAFARRARE